MKIHENLIIVYRKEPGRPIVPIVVENELKPLQNEVGGYIESVTIADDLVILCNEDGRNMGLPYNCKAFGIQFVGTILFVGVRDDEFVSCRYPANKLEAYIND